MVTYRVEFWTRLGKCDGDYIVQAGNPHSAACVVQLHRMLVLKVKEPDRYRVTSLARKAVPGIPVDHGIFLKEQVKHFELRAGQLVEVEVSEAA